MNDAMSLTRRVSFVVLGVTFLVAGVLKSWHPVEFAAVLKHMLGPTAADYTLRLMLVAAIASWEVTLGLLLLAQPRGRRTLWATLATLLVFTAVLVSLLSRPNPPSCGCLSVPLADSGRDEVVIGLIRNVALLWLAAWLLRTRSASPAPARTPLPRVSPGRAGGFTILELCIVIATIGTLLALLSPALAASRRAGKDAARLAIMRDVHGAVASYSDAYHGVLPYVQQPGQPFTRTTIDGRAFQYAYFDAQKWLWANFIWPDFLPCPRTALERPELREVNESTRGFPSGVIVSEVFLTFNSAASPRYWSGERLGLPRLLAFGALRPMRLDQVRFPASKGLLMFGQGFSFADDRGLAFVATADGAARFHRYAAFDPTRVVTRPFGAFPINVMSTRDGFEGTDY